MGDYQTIKVGSLAPRGFTLANRTTGGPITGGTVNHYLKALTGANAGKWWRASDNTWQAGETANPMVHQSDGHWVLDIAASPWTDGVHYRATGTCRLPPSFAILPS